MNGSAPNPIAEVLATAARGWPVFPVYEPGVGGCSCGAADCDSPGKHPRIKGWQTAATTDPAQIERWAAQFPGCNWGAPTGRVFDVLDTDPRHGGDETIEAFEEANGTLPEGPIGLTGGGGLHNLFRSDPSHSVKNGANVLGPGVDVRGIGGFVVIPPSVHASGRVYAWNGNAHPDDMALPSWTEPLLKRVNGATPGLATAPRLDVPAVLAGVPEGHREASIFRLACKLRRADVPEDAALDVVLKAASNAVPPFQADRAAERVHRAYRTYPPGMATAEPDTIQEPEGFYDDDDERAALAMLAARPTRRPAAVLEPASFRDVSNPDVLAVPWLIEGLIPASGLTIVAAHYKTGKSFLVYRLILDALFGKLALGSFPIPRPLKVQLWQFEMPLDVNLRRFHKLAKGMGIDPERIYEAERAGQFQAFIQPELSLTDAGDLAVFHEAVTTFGPDLLLVDSLSEAFADADFNSSTDVRRMLRHAFRPVTVDGRGTLALHHKRKASSNGKADDDKGSILGSQAFGAAARTVYTLDRVLDDGPQVKGRFVVSLAPQGGWDLESSGSVFVIADNEAGTLTTVDPAQGKKGKAFKSVTATMQAALRLAELVGSRHTIGRQSAFEIVRLELKCGGTTVKDALRLAVERGWIVKGKAEGTTQNEQVLQKGPNTDWEDEL